MIHHPWTEPPAEAQAVEVAKGVLWLRLPLPMALDHVNVYALDDGDSWTVVDTGFSTKRTKAMWQAIMAGPLGGKPVRRLIVTHHHPDHIGLAGWFQAQGAELITTRTAWLLARMLVLDVEEVHSPESLLFYRRAGIGEAALAERAAARPYNFADVVAPMPVGYSRVDEGSEIIAGGRRWLVRIGHGHAPDHLTLWSLDDDLVIGGDQLLPGISANIGVYPTEPESDPLGEWLTSTARFVPLAQDHQLILPGHKLPFMGLPFRLKQMAQNHIEALERLRRHLSTPQRAVDCFVPLFKREVTGEAYGFALVEAVAHLNHLLHRGKVSRHFAEDGAWLWQAIEENA